MITAQALMDAWAERIVELDNELTQIALVDTSTWDDEQIDQHNIDIDELNTQVDQLNNAWNLSNAWLCGCGLGQTSKLKETT